MRLLKLITYVANVFLKLPFCVKCVSSFHSNQVMSRNDACKFIYRNHLRTESGSTRTGKLVKKIVWDKTTDRSRTQHGLLVAGEHLTNGEMSQLSEKTCKLVSKWTVFCITLCSKKCGKTRLIF